jgi:hypothetical protein
MTRAPLSSLFLIFAMTVSLISFAAERQVNVDITMGKIVSLIKNERWSETLPYFDQIEASGEKIPESFYYYQIEALYKSKNIDTTLAKVDAYMKRYGKRGKYYAKVVEIGSEVSLVADKLAREEKAAADKQAAANAEYEQKMRQYERAMVVYNAAYDERSEKVEQCRKATMIEGNRCYEHNVVKGILGTDYTATERKQRWCAERYNEKDCDRNFDKVREPVRPSKP